MMLVLFAPGMSNLLWMAGATVVIAVEKMVPRRGLMVVLAGVFFLFALLWCFFSVISW
jgi:predicted metal-binding membrane protein